jgi:hypothetical protein
MQRNGASVPRRRLTPAVRPLPISSKPVLGLDLFRRFSRLQNFVAGMFLFQAMWPPVVMALERPLATVGKKARSAFLRQRLVMLHHTVLDDVMLGRVMLDGMVPDGVVFDGVMLHHMMMVDDMVMMMFDHLDLLRCRRLGAARGEHRAGKSHRHGNADRGKKFRVHGMNSFDVNDAA